MDINKIIFKDKLSAEELISILDAHQKDKEITMATVRSCLAKADINSVVTALQRFSSSDKDLTQQSILLINSALDIIKQELNKELSFQQKMILLDRVADLVDKAIKQTRDHRESNSEMAKIIGGCFVAAAGIAVLILTRGKNKEIATKGMRMIKGSKF